LIVLDILIATLVPERKIFSKVLKLIDKLNVSCS